MCKKKNCERHELWGGFCLPHLKEALGIKDATNRRRRKKIDAVEVETTDAAVDVETRTKEEE